MEGTLVFLLRKLVEKRREGHRPEELSVSVVICCMQQLCLVHSQCMALCKCVLIDWFTYVFHFGAKRLFMHPMHSAAFNLVRDLCLCWTQYSGMTWLSASFSIYICMYAFMEVHFALILNWLLMDLIFFLIFFLLFVSSFCFIIFGNWAITAQESAFSICCERFWRIHCVVLTLSKLLLIS